MSVPRPIVRCENEAVRTQLRKDLYAMGFCAGCGTTNSIIAMWGAAPYVTLHPNGKCQYANDQMPIGLDTDGLPYALLNSPSHMLTYIKRHGLAPNPKEQTNG